jgi:hypothetical protein
MGVASGYAKDQQMQLTGVWLSLAGAILVLAIIAPHVDDWLSRLAGLKTSVIEIQLTSLSSASKAVQPAQRDPVYPGLQPEIAQSIRRGDRK